mgnify:CR=1 FL=1
MKSRDFVIWVDGFIEGKINLGVDEIRHIKNNITEVEEFHFWEEMWNESEKINKNEKNTTEDSVEDPSLGV